MAGTSTDTTVATTTTNGKPAEGLMGVQGGPITATPASEWRRKAREGEWFTLPGSGNIAKLRRPGLIAMALKGTNIPNPLAQEIREFLAEEEADLLSRRTDEQRMERFDKNSRALGAMCRLVFMDPKIADEGKAAKDDEIELTDIPDADMAWVGHHFLEGRFSLIADFRLAAEPGKD